MIVWWCLSFWQTNLVLIVSWCQIRPATVRNLYEVHFMALTSFQRSPSIINIQCFKRLHRKLHFTAFKGIACNPVYLRLFHFCNAHWQSCILTGGAWGEGCVFPWLIRIGKKKKQFIGKIVTNQEHKMCFTLLNIKWSVGLYLWTDFHSVVGKFKWLPRLAERCDRLWQAMQWRHSVLKHWNHPQLLTAEPVLCMEGLR